VSPELTRRALLSGGSGLLAGLLLGEVVDDEEEAVIGPVGGGEPTIYVEGTLGEWPAIVTNDWDSVEIDAYPTLVYHLSGGLVVFSDGGTYRTAVEEQQMFVKLTDQDASDVSIDQLPTLLIELTEDGSAGNQTLFREGDL